MFLKVGQQDLPRALLRRLHAVDSAQLEPLARALLQHQPKKLLRKTRALNYSLNMTKESHEAPDFVGGFFYSMAGPDQWRIICERMSLTQQRLVPK